MSKYLNWAFFMKILLSPSLRWLIFCTVLILNFIAYYQDPGRYTLERKCYLSTPCKWSSYVLGMGTFTLDILTFVGLWYTIKPSFLNFLPDYWFLPLIVLGYAIITQITVDSPVVSNTDNGFDAPPENLWPIRRRIMLYTAILILDAIMFIIMYVDAGLSDYKLPSTTVFDSLIKNKFGGWKGGNEIQFLFAWLGIGGVVADSVALYFIYTYNACDYNMPVSWNF